MFKGTYSIALRPGQRLRLVGVGDVHFDTEECDQDRLKRFVQWVQDRERLGEKVRLFGMGDYLDFASPTERLLHTSGKLHETTNMKIDRMHLTDLRELLALLAPIRHCFLGLLTGHHHYLFATYRVAGEWQGRSSDAWLAKKLGCDYWGTGVAFFRLGLSHGLHLECLAWHGGGGAQTPGGRVQKRMRVAEIAPGAHLVFVGHDNAKLAYPRSGLDFSQGYLKRYVIGTGSFQRAYLGGTEAGYVEQKGLIPADLGVTVVDVGIEQRDGRWRTDFHVSV